MTVKEIDAHIMACPYFGGKDCIDRKIFADGMTHIGSCALEFHYRKICPSEECICAKKFELKGTNNEYKKWEISPKIKTEGNITTCITVPMFVLEEKGVANES